MFEKFLSGNIDNFRQRYEGTYGFFRSPSSQRLLVRLESISRERCDFVDGNGIPYYVYPDAEEEAGFEFLNPKSAWYNSPKGAIFTSRQATRQFSRGINDRNTELLLLVGGELLPAPVNFEFLSLVFSNEAKENGKWDGQFEKKLSWAVSPQFALGHGRLYLYKELVGTYTKKAKEFTFKLNEPTMWKTEIVDALTAMGYTAEVTKNG